MKRTFAALFMAIIMLLSLTACSPAPSAEYTVGIVQLTQHTALDEAAEGFIAAVEEALPGKVTFEVENASGDLATCSSILNEFVSAGVDLILANSTPALQTAVSATGQIPILGTSVTEYGAALSIPDFDGLVGGNISGTSDLAPLDAQADMVKEWFPNAKTIGMLYCSSEANSQYQVDTVQAYLEEMGYACKQYPFADSNEMASVTQAAADNSDVIYVPTDNTIAANVTIVDNICRLAGIPVIGGDEAICAGCGVATLCVGYYDLGYATGSMAVKILTGETDISEMPIQYSPEYSRVYNESICTELGIAVPAGYDPIG
ncbi:MAG: ABC transporter substrate-binding protein [Clostridia bacterium]|nr:ABC transporter substrate-binding protein [Clostridia bacterium]